MAPHEQSSHYHPSAFCLPPHNRCSCLVFICLFCFLFKEGEEESKLKGIVFTPRAPSAAGGELPRVLIRRSSSSGDGAWALTWTLARGAARWSVQGEIKKKSRLHLQHSAAAAPPWICLSKQPFCACITRCVSSAFPFFSFFFSPSFSLLCRGDGNQQTEYRQQRRLQPLEVCSP